MMMSFVNLFSLLRSYENAAVNSPENTAALVDCAFTLSALISSKSGRTTGAGMFSSHASVAADTSVAGLTPSAS